MTKYQIIYWRDIPVQVRARNRRSRHTQPLSTRFQQAVHRAAFRAKAINGFDYIEEWRTTDWQEQAAAAVDIIVTIADSLEKAYSDKRLNDLAHNKGYEPNDH
jgi:hypothetical protein